jgi:hypothetical protein
VTAADDVRQLQEQQALFTSALEGMVEGAWCGEGSAAAYLLAINPTLEIQCRTPVLVSQAPEPPPYYLANYDPTTYMPPQAASWTCSACSLAWLLRALQLDPNCDEWCGVTLIGTPENINPTYGLMDGSGAQLRRVLGAYSQPSSQAWLSFDQAYATYSTTPGCMSGGAWYHWTGVRGVDGAGNLWIANSAPGYMGVWDTLSRSDFGRLGPFSCVWTTE